MSGMTVGGTKYEGCQLANHWEGWGSRTVGNDYVLVEPKLDGYRLSALVNPDSSISFHCREEEKPKWIEHLGHIALEIQELALEPGWMLDGEVMAEDWNETSKLLRTHRVNMDEDDRDRIRQEVKFNVFDVVNLNALQMIPPVGRQRKPRKVWAVKQAARRRMLEGFLGLDREPGWALQLVPQEQAFDGDEVNEIYVRFCATYEGAIVKDPIAPYYFNRSDAWLKIKPTTTTEITITRVVEGQGKHVGRLGALVGTTAAGVEVSVGTGQSDAERERLWAMREQLPGMLCEISHQSGKVATARHPVFHRVRDLG